MADSATQEAGKGSIEASLSYAIDTGVKPVNETMGPGDMSRRRSGKKEMRSVVLRDGRDQAFDFDVNGFVFVDHDTRVKDFFDADELRSVYYPEVVALIKKHSGAARVHVFDHTLRSGDQTTREERLIREPVLSVHNDYTEWSGPQRVRDLLPDEADELLKRRFAIIQVWRAIRNPIESNPLAIADGQNLAAENLIASERRYPDRVGETYQISYSADHRWFYFPRMRRDEALVFKVYDSETDGRARFTAHTAFDDPTTPPGAAARESIEIRTLAFF